MNKKDSSPLIFYKLAYFALENQLEKLFDIVKNYEPDFRKKCIANKNNNDYDKLLLQSIKNGYIELFDMLKDLDVINDKDLNKYIEMAIASENERFMIYIYDNKEKLCTKIKLKKPIKIIKNLLSKNFYEISKRIYKDYISEETVELEEIEELYNIIINKGELHLIKFLYEIQEETFKKLYTDLVIVSIQNAYLDIFYFLAEVLNIKELHNNDKLDLLEIALYTNNEDAFEIIYEIIEPVDLTHPSLELMKKAKKMNKNIFAFLYTEANNQIRRY
jgi:hypothetical protein